MEAFMRQGFIPFAEALGAQPDSLRGAISVLKTRFGESWSGPTPRRPIFVGIGASLAAVSAPVAYLREHGVQAWRFNSAEIENERVDVGDVLVVLSQSGRSRETFGVLRRSGMPSTAVVNVADSPIADASDEVVSLGGLPDSLASSIGYTASVVAVSMLSERWATGDVSPHWDTLADRVASFVEAGTSDFDRLADLVLHSSMVDLVGPVEQVGAAEAAALLIREVTRVPASCFDDRQYMHGLMEASRPDTLHVFIDGSDTGQMVRPLLELGRQVVVLSRQAPAFPGATMVALPAVTALETPVFVAVLCQQVSLRVARHRGIDPDEFLFLETDTKLGDEE